MKTYETGMIALVVAVGLSLTAPMARAATYTWTNQATSTANWSSTANWVADGFQEEAEKRVVLDL